MMMLIFRIYIFVIYGFTFRHDVRKTRKPKGRWRNYSYIVLQPKGMKYEPEGENAEYTPSAV